MGPHWCLIFKSITVCALWRWCVSGSRLRLFC
nr:MAG TPA: hypothetical protein [Caudoviricetes sp.]